MGVLTNGYLGTENEAEAFIGSYSGTARVVSGAPKGMIRIRFDIKNTSDWNSATKVIPRSNGRETVAGIGRRVDEHFTWTEQWKIGTVHPDSIPVG